MRNSRRVSRLLKPLVLGAAIVCAGCALASTDALFKAASLDDPGTVRKLSGARADLNALNGKGDTALIVAIREGSSKAVKALLDAPTVDIDKPNLHGETPLMMASLKGDLRLVRLLVEDREVEVNRPGWTPLHYAATGGHLEIVAYLLEQSAYIDAASPNGTTPLMMAASGGHIRIVKLLLDEGADMSLRNQQGMTVMDFADRYQQREIADGLRSRWRKLNPGSGW